MVESRLVPVSQARTICCELVTNRVRRHQRGLRTCLLQNQATANTSCRVHACAQKDRTGTKGSLTNAGCTGISWITILLSPHGAEMWHKHLKSKSRARALFSHYLPRSQLSLHGGWRTGFVLIHDFSLSWSPSPVYCQISRSAYSRTQKFL